MSEFVSAPARWVGNTFSTLVVLSLLLDSALKFWHPPQVYDAMTRLGYPLPLTVTLGVILLIATLLYAIPRTAVLGAILLTGYLGGASASHLRLGDPLPSHVLVPVYIGVLAWTGLYLRDARVRALVPLR